MSLKQVHQYINKIISPSKWLFLLWMHAWCFLSFNMSPFGWTCASGCSTSIYWGAGLIEASTVQYFRGHYAHHPSWKWSLMEAPVGLQCPCHCVTHTGHLISQRRRRSSEELKELPQVEQASGRNETTHLIFRPLPWLVKKNELLVRISYFPTSEWSFCVALTQ